MTSCVDRPQVDCVDEVGTVTGMTREQWNPVVNVAASGQHSSICPLVTWTACCAASVRRRFGWGCFRWLCGHGGCCRLPGVGSCCLAAGTCCEACCCWLPAAGALLADLPLRVPLAPLPMLPRTGLPAAGCALAAGAALGLKKLSIVFGALQTQTMMLTSTLTAIQLRCSPQPHRCNAREVLRISCDYCTESGPVHCRGTVPSSKSPQYLKALARDLASTGVGGSYRTAEAAPIAEAFMACTQGIAEASQGSPRTNRSHAGKKRSKASKAG